LLAQNKIDDLGKTQSRLHHKEKEAKKALDHERVSQRRQSVALRQIEGKLHKFVNREDEKVRRAQMGRKELEAEMERMEEEHEKALTEIEEKYKGTIATLEETVTRCKEEYTQKVVDLSKACEQRIDAQAAENLQNIQALSASISSVEQRAVHLSADNAQLQKQLEASIHATSSEKSANEALATDVSQLKADLAKMESHCQQLESENARKDIIATNLASRSERVHQMYLEVCRSSEEQAEDLDRQFSEANDDIRLLEEAVRAKEELIERLEEDLGTQRCVNRDQNEAMLSMSTELDTLRRSETNQLNTINDIQSAYHLLSNDLHEVQEANAQQALQLRTSNDVNDSLESRLSHLKALYEDTIQQLTSSSQKADAMQQELTQTKWSFELLHKQHEELTKACESKESESAALQAEQRSLRGVVAEWEQKFRGACADITHLQSEGAAKDAAASEARAAIEALTRDVAAADQRVIALQGQLSTLITERESVLQKLENTENDLIGTKSKFANEISTLEDTFSELKWRHNELITQKDSLSTQLKVAEKDLSESVSLLEAARDEGQRLSGALAVAEEKAISLEQVVADLREQIGSHETQLDADRTDLAHLQTELKESGQEREALSTAVADMQRSMCDLTARRDDLQSRTESLTMDLQHAREERCQLTEMIEEGIKKVAGLQYQLSEQSDTLENVQADYQVAMSMNQELSANLDVSRNECVELHAKLADIDMEKVGHVDSLEKDLSTVKAQLKSTKDANVQLRLKLCDVEAQYDELRGQFKLAEAQKNKLLVTLQESEREGKTLHNKLSTAKSDVTRLQEQVSSLQVSPTEDCAEKDRHSIEGTENAGDVIVNKSTLSRDA
jgi:chromosome segregation ATPase